MSRGRANGEGSIFPYRNTWAAYVWVTTPDGQKDRKWIYGKTREEVYPEWVQLKAKAAKIPIPTATPTVSEYFPYWLEEVIKPNREDNTYSHYELMGRLHVIPGVGHKKIDPKKLTVRVVQAWLNKMPGICQCCAQEKDAKRRKPKCCAIGECCEDYPSKRVIEAARGALRAMLNHAMHEELIDRNVAELAKLPKARKRLRRRNSWTVTEARKFLESSRDENDPLYPLWVLILVLGLRKGEALGLVEPPEGWRYDDEENALVDLEWQLQRVGGHPLTHKQVLKADGSTDTLPLPAICLTALKIARHNRESARSDDWPETCICGARHQLVLTTRNGLPIEPRNVNRAFDVRCARYGVRRITIHDTRRTCGSLLAALDVHPRVAMQILRHSRIGLTMEFYTQVPDKATRDALRRLSEFLGTPQEKSDERGQDGERGEDEQGSARPHRD
ncbi:MAG: tyrosine-type recombinase/integrase [Nocardiopsaceae bacterium]|nr:tyrosine-type recombinase/integrase [Nocardiopsaceae bacterium]